MPTGQLVTPVGRQLKLEERPYWMALSPDGSHLLISNAGVETQSVMLVDVATQKVVDEIEYPAPESSTLQVAFSPDGANAYVSAGPNKLIRTYEVGASALTELESIELTTPDAWPAGITVSHDGGKLYVADEIDNALSIVDVSTGSKVQYPSRREPAGC